MCYSQYPSEGLDLLNKIKNIEVYMGNDNTKALSVCSSTSPDVSDGYCRRVAQPWLSHDKSTIA